MNIFLLRLNRYPIFLQLQLEEALLRADDRNWCIINEGSSPAIVLGISGKVDQHIDLCNPSIQSTPIIRRFSGGGTVIVDENTLFHSFICNSSELGVDNIPERVFGWSEQIYKSVFAGLDFRLREHDYVIGERKFGGNAQYMRKGRWLHHTSFLWDYEENLMNNLLLPPKMPTYRGKRSHSDFLCRLCDHYATRDILYSKFVAALKDRYAVIDVHFEDIKDILNKPHRQATATWTLESGSALI